MRDIRNGPLFLRLGARMRGPKGVPVGTLKRVLISNVSSWGALPEQSAIIPASCHPVEDIKISDVYFIKSGGH